MTSIGNVFNGINGLLGHKSTDWGSWVMGGGDPWGRSKCAQKPKNPCNKMKATMVILHESKNTITATTTTTATTTATTAATTAVATATIAATTATTTATAATKSEMQKWFFLRINGDSNNQRI